MVHATQKLVGQIQRIQNLEMATPAAVDAAGPEGLPEGLHPITQAVVDGAGRIAIDVGARLGAIIAERL